WCYHPHAIQSESRPRILMKHKLLDIARRLLILLLVVWTVVSLVTILIELVPGDPAVAILGDQATPEQIAQFRRKHGLDRPAFFVGPLFICIFAVWLGWLAPSGRFGWSSIILPAVTLGLALSALLTRMVRSSVIEELGEDNVRTARAKGLSERKVVYKHVLKNGLIPVVT